MILSKPTTLIYASVALACARATAQDVDASHTEICEQVASKMAATPQHRETIADLMKRDHTEITIDGVVGLESWAARRNPPMEVPSELAQLVKRLSSPHGTWTLSQLPGTKFHALHSVDGTMHCYSSIYFAIHDDQIQLRRAPPGLEGEDGACMVSRTFASIDGVPVMLEEMYTRTPAMMSWLTIASWDGDRFASSCRINFEYEPTFEAGHTDPAIKCGADDCARLKDTATRLAKEVQRSPSNARQSLLSALTPVEREQYLAASTRANRHALPLALSNMMSAFQSFDIACIRTGKRSCFLPLCSNISEYRESGARRIA